MAGKWKGRAANAGSTLKKWVGASPRMFSGLAIGMVVGALVPMVRQAVQAGYTKVTGKAVP